MNLWNVQVVERVIRHSTGLSSPVLCLLSKDWTGHLRCFYFVQRKMQCCFKQFNIVEITNTTFYHVLWLFSNCKNAGKQLSNHFSIFFSQQQFFIYTGEGQTIAFSTSNFGVWDTVSAAVTSCYYMLIKNRCSSFSTGIDEY